MLGACGGDSGDTAALASAGHSTSLQQQVVSANKAAGAAATGRTGVAAMERDPSNAARSDAGTSRAPFFKALALASVSAGSLNGRRYDDSGTRVEINGRPASLGQLQAGMVAYMEGERDQDTGLRRLRAVYADSLVQGPIESFNAGAGRLTVLGIPIQLAADAAFHPAGSGNGSLKPGDFVEVHGFPASAGGIAASAIQVRPAATEFSITGTVRGLNRVMGSMSLYGLNINIANARPAGIAQSIADGMTVQARGRPAAGAGWFEADELRVIHGAQGRRNAADASVEGPISDFSTSARFRVNGIDIDASGASMNGVVGNNVWVQVEGAMTGGKLIAASVERGTAAAQESEIEDTDTPIQKRFRRR
jgi:hypothetical protein